MRPKSAYSQPRDPAIWSSRWTGDSAENSIVLELYQGTCTVADILEDRLTGTCSDATLVAIADEVPAVKPNVLTAPNLAAGTYTLMIEYFGETGSQTTETVTFTHRPERAVAGCSRLADLLLDRALPLAWHALPILLQPHRYDVPFAYASGQPASRDRARPRVSRWGCTGT